jgi:hypothetical protein
MRLLLKLLKLLLLHRHQRSIWHAVVCYLLPVHRQYHYGSISHPCSLQLLVLLLLLLLSQPCPLR